MISKSTADTRMSVPTSRPSRRESDENLGAIGLLIWDIGPCHTPRGAHHDISRDITRTKLVHSAFLSVQRPDECEFYWTSSVLHTHMHASWYMHTVLKSNWNHACSGSCIGIDRELSVVFSSTEDQAWSQYSRLHNEGCFKKIKIHQRCWGIWALWEMVKHNYKQRSMADHMTSLARNNQGWSKNYNKASKCRTSMNIKQWSHYGSPHTVTHVSC